MCWKVTRKLAWECNWSIWRWIFCFQMTNKINALLNIYCGLWQNLLDWFTLLQNTWLIEWTVCRQGPCFHFDWCPCVRNNILLYHLKQPTSSLSLESHLLSAPRSLQVAGSNSLVCSLVLKSPLLASGVCLSGPCCLGCERAKEHNHQN